MTVLMRAPQGLDVEVLQGEAVHRALEDSDFVLRWSDLFARCTWSTVYQSVEYAKAWYRCYGDAYDPLLIRGFSVDESLAGILALGVSKENGKLVHVGTPHAEYEAWLAGRHRPEVFLEAALDVLSKQYPGAGLSLHHLSPGAPIDWARSGRWASRCIILEAKRSVMELKIESIRESLRKRSNRNRFSRLRRQGQLEFHRLTDVDTLARTFDAIAPQCDLRRMALYGMQPFQSDYRKQAFYLELMRSARLHATVSTVDGRIVAATIGVCDQNTVYLDLICHSPMCTAESPGKLHLLTLAQRLVTEGYKYIDLTPGDSLWKDRSATSYDVVHQIDIAFSRRGLLRNKIQVVARHRTKRLIKCLFSHARLEPRSVKYTVEQLTDEGLRGIVGKAIQAIVAPLCGARSMKRFLFERVDVSSATESHHVVKRDALDDLLLSEARSVKLKRAFLRRAHERLCAGEHAFTCAEGGRLMGLCWIKQLANRGENHDGVSSKYFVLHDPYFHPLADPQRLCLAIVRTIAKALGSQLGGGSFDIRARHTDRELIAALNELQRELHPNSKRVFGD
jgi:CelD/BcsL family acetyltransferase involved in cellulose biosynthesis